MYRRHRERDFLHYYFFCLFQSTERIMKKLITNEFSFLPPIPMMILRTLSPSLFRSLSHSLFLCLSHSLHVLWSRQWRNFECAISCLPKRFTCGLRKRSPATFSMFLDVINELLVFLFWPSSLVYLLFITARFPHITDMESEREREWLTTPTRRLVKKEYIGV